MLNILKFAMAALHTVGGAQIEHFAALVEACLTLRSMAPGQSKELTAAGFSESGANFVVRVTVERSA